MFVADAVRGDWESLRTRLMATPLDCPSLQKADASDNKVLAVVIDLFTTYVMPCYDDLVPVYTTLQTWVHADPYLRDTDGDLAEAIDELLEKTRLENFVNSAHVRACTCSQLCWVFYYVLRIVDALKQIKQE